MVIYRKKKGTGFVFILLLGFLLTGCSRSLIITGSGHIIIHLTKKASTNTTSLLNSVIETAYDSSLPRSTSRVISLLKGYRIRIKGNNQSIIRDAFFTEGQTEVSLSVSVPAGSGYKVQILALGQEINPDNRLLLGGGEAADVQVLKDEDIYVQVNMHPYRFNFRDNPETTTADSPFNIKGTISGPLVSDILDLDNSGLYYYRNDQITGDAAGEAAADLSWEVLDDTQLKFVKGFSGLASGPFYFQFIGRGAPSWENNGTTFSLAFPCLDTGENNLLPAINIEESAVNQIPLIELTAGVSAMTATLSGNITDNDGTVTEAVINWGDGSTRTIDGSLTGLSASHTYPGEGSYTITVTAADNQGAVSSAEYPVTIQLPPPLNPELMVNVPAGTTSSANGGLSLGYSLEMGRYEVTHGEYISFLNSAAVTTAGVYNGQEVIDLDDQNCAVAYDGSFYFKGSDEAASADCPVMEVSWYGLLTYCNWLSEQEGLTPAYDLNTWQLVSPDPSTLAGYRLPTSKEWEYAARGGAGGEATTYAGSDLPDEVAWYFNNYDTGNGRQSHPVGQKEPNELGLYDMSGNIGEWTCTVDDVYDEYYLVRGGDWNSTTYCEVSNVEAMNTPDYSREYVGFRLTRTK